MKLASYILGYIDLLGFSSGVLDEEDDPSHLMGRQLKFMALKTSAARVTRSAVQHHIDIRWLSDSCIIASHLSDLGDESIVHSLDTVCTAVGILQTCFASEDHFSRGGIAIGRMAQHVAIDGTYGPNLDAELFGPALVRAAEIEKAVSAYPRVCISARLVPFADRLPKTEWGRRKYTFDLPIPHVDYLSFAEHWEPQRPAEILAGHAELVHNLIIRSAAVPGLRAKARWLRAYHNWHVENRGELDRLIIRVTPPGDEERPVTNDPPADFVLREGSLGAVESVPRRVTEPETQ